MTLSINDTQHNYTLYRDYAECRYSERRVSFIFMLSVIIVNVIMPSVMAHSCLNGAMALSIMTISRVTHSINGLNCDIDPKRQTSCYADYGFLVLCLLSLCSVLLYSVWLC
jgi:hypothetical protein